MSRALASVIHAAVGLAGIAAITVVNDAHDLHDPVHMTALAVWAVIVAAYRR
jgi:hypothetical protein